MLPFELNSTDHAVPTFFKKEVGPYIQSFAVSSSTHVTQPCCVLWCIWMSRN